MHIFTKPLLGRLCFAPILMNIRIDIIIIGLIGFSACNNKKTNKVVDKDESTSSQVIKLSTGFDVEPKLGQVDSVQILYYDKPDGDSLRYTRFFKYVNLTDSFFIESMKEELKQSFTGKNEMDKCRSEGKMYLYHQQEIIKTIYFSTRCDKCCHLYFIKNGSFIYFNISVPFAHALNTLRKKAVMP